ncbi:MAG: sugar phosphate isomerase/epimerase [Chitinophagaceae bacterium]|nr:MAG: sugar phosphate isomerase/epimerase [Chitinophagaceae bacterium]
MHRRAFLQHSSLLVTGSLLRPSLLSAKKPAIGLQLYTVRRQLEQDPATTLDRVAQIGYREVELATYTGTQLFYGMKPADFAALLWRSGLKAVSSHYRLGAESIPAQQQQGTLLHGWDRAVDDAAALGLRYLVCAWLSPEERSSLDRYKALAETLNRAGERCRKAGLQLCYHNHDFEFTAIDGTIPYELLLRDTDKSLVHFELDLYWTAKAGQDPVALFERKPGRFPLWHIKDMDAGPAKGFTEVGRGTIDFERIFRAAATAGRKHFFVEQDETPGDPFDSIRSSYTYVRKHLASAQAAASQRRTIPVANNGTRTTTAHTAGRSC